MQLVNSIFKKLGYQVLGLADGVYRLMALDGVQQFVAVLRSANPLPADARHVTLVLFPIEAGVPVGRVIAHWQNLDIRRIGAADATITDIDIPAGIVPSAPPELTYLRPDGSGLRYAVQLATGDVVCFN